MSTSVAAISSSSPARRPVPLSAPPSSSSRWSQQRFTPKSAMAAAAAAPLTPMEAPYMRLDSAEPALSMGGGGEAAAYTWRQATTAAAAATANAWPNRGSVAASASSQFWMPPEDPWRWTRGAQPSSPTPTTPTPKAPLHPQGTSTPPTPLAHSYQEATHRYCYGCNSHRSRASDEWLNAKANDVYYVQQPPTHLEPSTPPRAPQRHGDHFPAYHQHQALTPRPTNGVDNGVDVVDAVGGSRAGASPAAAMPLQMQSVPASASTSDASLRQTRAMRSHVHYRRENTYHMGSSKRAAGIGTVAGSGGGADGDGGGATAGYAATMERLHHEQGAEGACVAVRGAVSAEAVTCESRRSVAASRSASCCSSVATRRMAAHPLDGRTGAAYEGSGEEQRTKSASVGGQSRGGSGTGSGVGVGGRLTTGITSNLSDYIWKPQEENAWELWYQKKRKEDQIRRRKEEKRKRMQEQQEAARKREESVKKELEEENRKKWLQRKKRQQEEEKRRLEEQKLQAEKRAREEAEKHEVRVRQHLEMMKKASQRREEMRKEEAQRREEAQRQAEEAKRVRQEQCARVLAEWNVRAATRPRPLTGCIFNHDPQASVPKPALDFFNPEPWQF